MNTDLPKILIIAGATASGKSSLALEIAKIIPSEILSADSRQIYNHLTIGTAKPSPEELKRVPHHFINLLEPNQKFSVWDFQQQGRRSIQEIISRNALPLVVGGTGLYLKALVDGIFEQPEFSKGIRRQLEERLRIEGAASLHRELEKVDAESAARIPQKRTPLIIRALEVFYETGIPISQFHADQQNQKIYNDYWFALHWERKMLYDRINMRVDRMIEQGLIEEIKNIQALGYDESLQALQTVGYKEVFQYLCREISKEKMIELIKQNTRRYAKRQMTWFRKEERISWIEITSVNEMKNIAERIVRKITAGK
ncbi:MAG: tRNA (adenosine(37)-N6)-dimethylallyltransferase MiaA [Bacteroidetes bacterium]|nr:tRNA (adenosine(37)-N6)-dimethylallyltransferase MiaA [Bacteroidota bacterium]